ncbi:MAG: UDP-N-acetyl-D-mannosaminuronic acid dehydrogenase [Alteromonadaceae bacterium]|jgi:UDP-N-acetyl-D-mannosaminuronic acid dehydrogenase
MDFQTISVIGLGYIGLPTAAAFAARQKQVIGVDINADTVATINRGEIHIVEPELDIVVRAAVQTGFLKATQTPVAADAFLLAVPTPFKDDHQPDLSYIQSAAQLIAPVLKKGDLVILESTSPVGATEKMVAWLSEARPDLTFPTVGDETPVDINVAHCPERVLPGQVMRELVENDRIIGGLTQACAERAVSLYRTFVTGQCIVTDARTAEMAKLTENAFRDVNIAFANELSLVCDHQNVDVWELIKLANLHPRVNILQPGPGVGGHCIAVDPWFIISASPEQAKLMKTARLVNDGKPQWVIEQVKSRLADCINHTDKTFDQLTVACLGLAFKPNIDDLRESPALKITQQLSRELSCQVLAVEPNIPVGHEVKNLTAPLTDLTSALAAADVVVLLVDHNAFKQLDPQLLKGKQLVDTRGVFK